MKRGYKQTEVGIIPEDWESTTIGDVATFSGGSQPPRSTFKFAPTKGYIRLIQIRDYKTDEYASFIPETMARKRCTADDIMIGRYGPPIFQILRGIDGAYNVALIKATPSQKTAREFFFYVLDQEKLFQLVDSLSRRSSGQTGVEMPALKAYGLPLPPLPEQRAIATALSDVDALLGALARLIAKKRDLKQAAMQQLLTGQTRLPGFHGEWEVRPLSSEVGGLDAGVSVNSTENDLDAGPGGSAVLKTSAVAEGSFFPSERKTIAPRDLGRVKLSLKAESIIISRMNTIDLVGECGYIPTDFPNLFVPDRLWITRFKSSSRVSAKWLAFILSTPTSRMLIRNIATGTSGSMKNISKGTFLALEFAFPQPEEQIAIAAVLTDMDAELAALEQRLAKTRALKQGMMQELLTGRTRMV